MIPEFPKFKKLEFADREAVEAITSKYHPYSDFNFTSVWAWNTTGDIQISQLHGNLVVRFVDYLTAQPFYSFIGDTNTSATAKAILECSQTEGCGDVLKIVPEISAQSLDPDTFDVAEERDHFDYILDKNKIAEYPGHTLRGHASFKRRFLEQFGENSSVRLLDLRNAEDREKIISLNKTWIENKVAEQKDVFPELEYTAMRRFLDTYGEIDDKRFIIVGIFHGDKIIAYTIDELLEGPYTLRHFMKGDNKYKGVYSHLLSEAAKILREHRLYTNIEQDLGLANLRQSKNSFEPVAFLKKYTVRLRNPLS